MKKVAKISMDWVLKGFKAGDLRSYCWFLLLYLSLVLNQMQAQAIKVACVGNSVTFGVGIENRDQNSYPAKLQVLLGTDYQVENFGFSGATLLKNGHKPYWDKGVYQQSLEFAPDIVIIHLGLNDQGMNNWPQHGDEFVSDYKEFIQSYRSLSSQPRVLICKMTPTLSGHHWFEEGMRESYQEIQDKIKQVADETNTELIDLHQVLDGCPEYLPDNLHPTKEGAERMAREVYGAITGDFGGLQLPVYFGENMIFQRNQPMIISGRADTGSEISIQFKDQTHSVIADPSGNWEVRLPASKAGGPYPLRIRSNRNEQFELEKVFIGEVWLASGQSNMAFKVKQAKGAADIIRDSVNDQIHFFEMRPNFMPDPGEFSEKEKSTLAENYMNHQGWSVTNSEQIKEYSAVAYAFAKTLQDELNVPVGIIHNAVGGSPTQSWVSRRTLETAHQTIDLLNDHHMNPMVHEWVSKRRAENMGTQANKRNYRHPYDPSFLFDASIRPLQNVSFSGVIWYQGESNANEVDLHEQLFELLVTDWRDFLGIEALPFYYVQLSSIDRPNWGAFRDSQRRLLRIPDTQMAVSSDLGHPRDVHPKNKWPIGKRLALLALNDMKDKKILSQGPMFDYVNIQNSRMIIFFKNGKGLKTSDLKEVKGIQVAGEDLTWHPADSRIKGEQLEVWSEKIPRPRYVRYGFSSFSTGNLINEANLPASTFTNYITTENEKN